MNFFKNLKLLIKIHELFSPNTLNKIHPIQRILSLLYNKSIFPNIFRNTICSFSFNYVNCRKLYTAMSVSRMNICNHSHNKDHIK